MSYLIKKGAALLVCLAIFLVGYNYFWGTEEEQQSSKEIIAQVHGLTGKVTELLRSEKEKYDQGKYDEALGKMKQTFAVLKKKAEAMGSDGKAILDKVNSLQEQEKALEEELASSKMEDRPIEPQGGGMMMSSPGSSGEPSDPPGPDDRLRRAEEIRLKLMELNQEADRITSQFS